MHPVKYYKSEGKWKLSKWYGYTNFKPM